MAHTHSPMHTPPALHPLLPHMQRAVVRFHYLLSFLSFSRVWSKPRRVPRYNVTLNVSNGSDPFAVDENVSTPFTNTSWRAGLRWRRVSEAPTNHDDQVDTHEHASPNARKRQRLS